MQSAVYNATDVRNNWSEFIDNVVRKGPQFVKRNNRDELTTISTEHLKAALQSLTFKVQLFPEADGTVTASLRDFGIVENGETEEEAIDAVAEELVEYALEYLEDFNLYFNSPNRRSHFIYILNVLIQDDLEGVKQLIHA